MTRRIGAVALLCGCAVVVVGVQPPVARAVELHVGDILISDAGAFGAPPGKIIRIDPVTGAQTLIASGGFLGVSTRQLAVDGHGQIFVATSSTIVRIDAATGAQSLFLTNSLAARALTTTPSGDLLAATGPDGRAAGIYRVNPTTGAQTSVYFTDAYGAGRDVALEPNGDMILLANSTMGIGRLIRVNGTTGASTVLSEGNLLTVPEALVLDGAGHAFVSTSVSTVVMVDLMTGVQSFLGSPSGLLQNPRDMTMEASGSLIVANNSSGGSVARLNSLTGEQSLVASAGQMGGPIGITVVTAVPATNSVALVLVGSVIVGTRRRRTVI